MFYDKAPFPSCHASTLVETPAGLVAAYFGGTAERNPDVCIWVSRHINGKWLPPQQVADGILTQPVNGTDGKPMMRVATWNPVLFQPKSGPLYLFYKVGPAPSLWWGEFKTSTDNGQTWSKATRLPEGILGPVKDKPIQLPDGTIVSGSSTENGGRHVHFELSTDNGQTWTRTPNLEDGSTPAGAGATTGGTKFGPIQPTFLQHPSLTGPKLQALFRTTANVIAESWSSDQGKTWSPLAATKLPNNDSGIDSLTLADGRFLLVYNPTHKEDPVKGRTPLNVAISKDGLTWTDILTLDNSLSGQFSYPAVIQSQDGLIHITYTYKRETIKYVVIDPKSF